MFRDQTEATLERKGPGPGPGPVLTPLTGKLVTLVMADAAQVPQVLYLTAHFVDQRRQTVLAQLTTAAQFCFQLTQRRTNACAPGSFQCHKILFCLTSEPQTPRNWINLT